MSDDDFDRREWGPWSVWKTEILLGGYLPLFTRASQSAPHRTFFDLFAGATENVQRLTHRAVMSSPRLALQCAPPFTHVVLFEQPDRAERLAAALVGEFPGRTIHVVPGDCNDQLVNGLAWWEGQGTATSGPVLGPTLAYLDPNSLQLNWATVERLATFRMRPRRGKEFVRSRPIELLVLFPTGAMRRTLPQPPRTEADDAAKSRVDRLFGGTDWRAIYEDQRAGNIVGEGSWLNYVEQYRYGLSQLGYEHTAAIEVRNTRNVVLYHMVFATAHTAGKKIMSAVMNRAREVLPRMIDEELRLRREQPALSTLFEDEDEVAVQAAAADPSRYAKLIDGPPSPYVPGPKEPPGDEQLGLGI